MKSKKFCNICKKLTIHEPDASTAITYYGKKPNVPWQCVVCYPTSLDKLHPKELQ
jgi:hypothetical protein